MSVKKAGSATVKTRAARRQITPAIEPGSLMPSDDGATNRRRQRLAHSLGAICRHFSKEKIPDFTASTYKMDDWLQGALNDERTGFLSAFVDQASMIQSNLHYRLVGSKSLVQRSLDLLHASEGGEGFRKLIKMTALNFYSSNFGGAVYLDRTDPVIASYLPNSNKWYWSTPPVQAMYATDSTLFRPNSDYVYPFSYDGGLWNRYDFFRIVSMPSTVLKTWGVGRCPLYRCIQIARMTSATYEHIYNTLSPDSAKGIITIKGMSGDEFLTALSGSEAVNEQDDTFKDGFVNGSDLGDIVVLADRDDEIVVKFVTLSRLPDGFFIDQWIRWTLTSFATNLGFPLEEFIGMPANRLLGQSGAEVQAGQQRGSTKGGRDFINGFQDNLQALVMPDTVLLEFADRDEGAELADVEIKSAKAKLVIDLFTATQLAIINKGDQSTDSLIEARAGGEHIIDRDEARRLLAEWNVVPWLSETPHPDITVDDTLFDVSQYRLKHLRERFRETQHVQRLAGSGITGEPVVMYESWVDRETGFMRDSEVTLWDDCADLSRSSLWSGATFDNSGVYDLSGPGAYKRRVPSKAITVEMAIDSDHAGDVARLLRKCMLAQIQYLQNGELSLDGFVEAGDTLSKKDVEALTSRLYALAGMGRDGVLGRRKVGDAVLADIVSANLRYAQTRCAKLLKSVLDGEVRQAIEAALATHVSNADIILDPRPAVLATLEETLRPRARELATVDAELAFKAGSQNATAALGIRSATQ